MEQYRMEAAALRQRMVEMTARAAELERRAEGISTALDEPDTLYVAAEQAVEPQRSLSVREMLDAYADQHGDVVRVAEAAAVFAKAGYWPSKRAARSTLYSTLRHFAVKGVYQKVGRGAYRKVPSAALNGSLRRVGDLTLIEPSSAQVGATG